MQAGVFTYVCAKSLMVQGRSGHGKRRGQDREGLCPHGRTLPCSSTEVLRVRILDLNLNF